MVHNMDQLSRHIVGKITQFLSEIYPLTVWGKIFLISGTLKAYASRNLKIAFLELSAKKDIFRFRFYNFEFSDGLKSLTPIRESWKKIQIPGNE